MKNLLLLLSISFIFSCRPNTEKQSESLEITFSLDTVMVDSKNEIFDLRSNLYISDFSEHRKYLYNFNSIDHSIEKIDLDNLEFVGRYFFEKEGPDGLGNDFGQIQCLPKDLFYMNNAVFNSDGKKISDLNFNHVELLGDTLTFQQPLNYAFLLENNPIRILGVFRDWFSNMITVGLVDTEKNTFNKMPVPEFDFLKDLNTTLNGDEGYPIAMFGPWYWVSKEAGKIIIGNNSSSDLYIYDLDFEEFIPKSFESGLTESRKTGTFPSEAKSRGEYEELRTKFTESVFFRNPVWDPSRQLYFRFSFEMRPTENQPKRATVYLSLLDPDFNLLSESIVGVLDKAPGFHFVKDEKIWIFENIDDEIGFVRLSFKP